MPQDSLLSANPRRRFCVPPRTIAWGLGTETSELGGSVGRHFAADRHFDNRGLFPLAHDRYLQIVASFRSGKREKVTPGSSLLQTRPMAGRRHLAASTKDEQSFDIGPRHLLAGPTPKSRYWARIHFTRISASSGETPGCGGIGVCPQWPPPPFTTLSLRVLIAVSSFP